MDEEQIAELLRQSLDSAIGMISSVQDLSGGGYEETKAHVIAAKWNLKPPPPDRDRQQLINDIYDLIPALPHRDLMYVKNMVLGQIKTNLEAQNPDLADKKSHDHPTAN